MDRDQPGSVLPSDDCTTCPLHDRRSFLRDGTLLLAGFLTFMGRSPLRAQALKVTVGRALRVQGDEITYPIPAADGATIDKDNQVILVRFEGKIYAFNLSCPHQNTALRWEDEEHQFQCPKHHSKYQPDGTFISGRATRGMDRFAIRRDAGNVVVNLDDLYQQDKNPDQWTAAVITV